jgi:hypothetical protein
MDLDVEILSFATCPRSGKMKYLAVLSYLLSISSVAFGLNYPSVTLPLPALFDNQAASADGTANFDAHGASFDSKYLPPGPWVHDGITVRLDRYYVVLK